MTTNPPPPNQNQPPKDAAQIDERAGLWARAVEVLTQAVRLTRPQGDGSPEPDDFADFLASVLAAAAANVGSVERVTAGRPGSWEAALVDQLLYGTVGDNPADLVAWRTEPVRIPLNVAQLVETDGPHAEPPVLTLDDATQALPWPDNDDGDAELSDEEWETAETGAIEAEDALRRRYTDAYQHYANQFRDVVDEEARTIPGLISWPDATVLRVPVEVVAETDPYIPWGGINNPSEWDDYDPLVWDLWNRARHRLGLPQP